MNQRDQSIPVVDPFGPVFVSYRQSDGKTLATSVAWALRCMGIPVWHDVNDLLPGDTEARLREALASGLSGGVLVVTPEIRYSRVIRKIEVPQLLRLHTGSDFSFAVGNAIAGSEPGRPDYSAPDRLLGRLGRGRGWLPPMRRHLLVKVKQYPLLEVGDPIDLAHAMTLRRMEALRQLGLDVLEIDVRTRVRPTPHQRPPGLSIRTPSPTPGQRLPNPLTWRPFAALLEWLPGLLEAAGTRAIRLTGNAHLTMALALGASVPITAGVHIEVVDSSGDAWQLRAGSGADLKPEVLRDDGDGAVAVAVEIADTSAPVDTFARHLDREGNGLKGALRLRRIGSISPRQGGQLARVAADQIRSFASEHATTRVHLFLRVPFPVAVLLGQCLNTFDVTTYEWDDTMDTPRYIPTFTVSPGHGSGPVREIHIKEGP